MIGRLMQDDSYNWYFVPAEMVGRFDDWITYVGGNNISYEGPDYSEFRMCMPPSQYLFEMKVEA